MSFEEGQRSCPRVLGGVRVIAAGFVKIERVLDAWVDMNLVRIAVPHEQRFQVA